MKEFYSHNKKIFVILLWAFAALPMFLPAQTSTAWEIENLLTTPAVSYGQAARIILEASDSAVIAGQEEAFKYALSRKWLPKSASAPAPARLDDISLLLMNSFNMSGGILYSIIKNPHYAYRELIYKNIIQGRTDPDMKVPGDDLLFYLGKMMDFEQNKKEREQKALAGSIAAQLKTYGLTGAKTRITEEGVTISLFDIQFLPDSPELTDSEIPKLRPVAAIIKNIPNRRLLVSGHTAQAGGEEGRATISLERAQAVADFLISEKVRKQNEITVAGYGSTRPIGDNNTPEGMKLNRRVEITLLEN
jgi:outer membrane protein OmpA-like peptidoglycan-associated protein